MKISEYQNRSFIAIQDHESERDRILNWVVGLGEEVGEILNVVKHGMWGGEVLNKHEIAKELGDVLWYASALATTLGIDLETVAKINVLKLETRFKEGVFNEEDSINRVQREKEMLESDEYKDLVRRLVKP